MSILRPELLLLVIYSKKIYMYIHKDTYTRITYKLYS